MNIIDKLRAIVSACDQRSRGMLAIVILTLSREWERLTKDNERLTLELQYERAERNRLQRQVNALICNGFQFEVWGQKGMRQLDEAAIRANWNRGYTTGRILEAAETTVFENRIKDRMGLITPFDLEMFENAERYQRPEEARFEMSKMLTNSLVPHVVAAVCEIRGDSATARAIREKLERDRKEFCR